MNAIASLTQSPNGISQSRQAEEAVVGRLLADPAKCSEVTSLLEPRHFALAHTRLLYAAIQEAYYANADIDPLSFGERHAKRLGELWGVAEAEAVQRVTSIAEQTTLGSPASHAAIIRRHSERRRLRALANSIVEKIDDDDDPQAVAALVGEEATKIATDTVTASELVSLGDAGRRYVNTMRFERAAREQGVELGVKTGLRAVDDFTRGFRPGRLMIFAGEPGVGKSAVAWKAGMNFAERQARRPEGERIGTLILSMEMGEDDSSARFAQVLSGIPADTFAEASFSEHELEQVIRAWSHHRDAPLWLNYAPHLRASQMLALVSDAIRKYNVGFVIVDHFRTFDLDRRLLNKNDEDEEKARFLKEQIARSMNVAVMCLAHTRKPDAGSAGGRPHMADLRGSGQIAAHADMVSFLYRPAMYASPREIESGDVDQTDAEVIHRKNRHGPLGAGGLYYDPAAMSIH